MNKFIETKLTPDWDRKELDAIDRYKAGGWNWNGAAVGLMEFSTTDFLKSYDRVMTTDLDHQYCRIRQHIFNMEKKRRKL